MIADETSDISRKEQLSVSLRYTCTLDSGEVVIEENFLTMLEVRDVTGAGLKRKLQETLTDLGRYLRYFVKKYLHSGF